MTCYITSVTRGYSQWQNAAGIVQASIGDVVNYLLSPEILAMRKGDRPGMVNLLEYYLR